VTSKIFGRNTHWISVRIKQCAEKLPHDRKSHNAQSRVHADCEQDPDIRWVWALLKARNKNGKFKQYLIILAQTFWFALLWEWTWCVVLVWVPEKEQDTYFA